MGAVTGLPNAGQTIAGAGIGGALGGGLLGPVGSGIGAIAGGSMGAQGALPTNLGPVGGMLGMAGGAAGTGIRGPQDANILAPTTPDQVAGANAGVGNSLAAQQALIQALQGNTGNLNTVYGQGQGAYGQLAGLNGAETMGAGTAGTGQLASSLAGANGVGLQSGAAQGLVDVLRQQQAIANGTGPNPAAAMLNQATGQNVANQAALMAGQRGAGANVGLMARQAAQQGAATQQQAAGQAATMQANQQLNALNSMGQTNQALAGIGSGLTGQQAQAFQSLYGQGQGAVAAQQAQQAMNSGIAQNQIANAMTAQNQGVQNNLANANQQMTALGGFNNAAVGSTGSVNEANAGIAGGVQKQQGQVIGGLMNAGGLGSKLATGGGAAAGARGGEVSGPRSSFGQFLAGRDFRSGGTVTAASSDQKATKGGNSYANDKIPAMLSEHEIVLPRSVTLSKNAPEAARRFVEALQAKKGRAS